MIEGANPSMATLSNVAEVLRTFRTCHSLVPVLTALLHHLDRSPGLVAENLRRFLGGERPSVVTISFSSTVLRAAAEGLFSRVVVLESRPGGEGVDMALKLRSLGIDTALVPDALAHTYVEQCDYVVFGADAVTGDGFVVNKVGSALLTHLAQVFGKRVVVLTEAFKATTRPLSSLPMVRRTFELPRWGEVELPVFEPVPIDRVWAVATEFGVKVTPPKNFAHTLWRRLLEELGAGGGLG